RWRPNPVKTWRSRDIGPVRTPESRYPACAMIGRLGAPTRELRSAQGRKLMRKWLNKLAALAGTVVLSVTILVSPVAAQSASTQAQSKVVVIDFSTHGQGSFPADFYNREGIVFTAGSFVGFIQGDDALIAEPLIAADFLSTISRLSVLV